MIRPFAFLIALLPASLSSAAALPATPGFADYQRQTIAWMQQHRAFQTADHAAEIAWNAPREWRPTGHPQKGILLVHGLGDSPWSFNDIGTQLAKQGYLVRTVLLPGHGTQPKDMLDVTLAQWQQVVNDQALVMRREVSQVFLGGFSTGANLVLDYAYKHDDIAGLVLFSPAFRPSNGYAWITQYISWLRPWLAKPDDHARPLQTPVRYLNVPTNGFAQFYRSALQAQEDLQRGAYSKPVFIAITQHDSVVDTGYILEQFNRRFTHPASRLIWYGHNPAGANTLPRILARSDYVPEQRIAQFSHMSLLFAPDNPLYGVQGSQRICWNGQEASDMQRCLSGEPVWYSDYGLREPGKVFSRLTYNPYFEWQTQVMLGVLKSASAETVQGAPGHRGE